MAEPPLPSRLNACLAAIRATLAPVVREALILPPAGPVRIPETQDAGLPVLRWLAQTAVAAPPATAAAVAEVAALAGAMVWRQTYGRDEASEAFLENYGWTELAGARGLVADPAMSAGLLLLGPHTLYAAHEHPAVEHYVPLSGTAHWWDEDRGWRTEAPLAMVLHRSGVRHAMRTGAEPLLAYFHWSGPGVSERARFSGRDEA